MIGVCLGFPAGISVRYFGLNLHRTPTSFLPPSGSSVSLECLEMTNHTRLSLEEVFWRRAVAIQAATKPDAKWAVSLFFRLPLVQH